MEKSESGKMANWENGRMGDEENGRIEEWGEIHILTHAVVWEFGYFQYWKMDPSKVGEVGGKEHAEFCFEVHIIYISSGEESIDRWQMVNGLRKRRGKGGY